MKKTTLKNIRSYVATGFAKDITHKSFAEIEALRKAEGYFEPELYSTGVYGCTGKLVRGANSGELYAITKANSTLYQVG